ncbi:MAG: hypothetical protein IPH16_17205 [Haliscomenobacter sp.]|nr:hypothetical protein [Haliscomenobacter sp.]
MCKEAGVNYHYIDFDEVFTIGLAHNYGAKIAIGEYILKQDVDCIPYVSFYDKVLDFLNVLRPDKRNWANIGVYYCNKYFSEKYLNRVVDFKTFQLAKENDDFKEEIKKACGNCYLINREHYLSFGGCSGRFQGYGWEDYQVLYYLKMLSTPKFRLSEYKIDSIVACCRDEIARPSNHATNELDIVFLHKWHDPNINKDNYRNYLEVNRKALLELTLNFNPK